MLSAEDIPRTPMRPVDLYRTASLGRPSGSKRMKGVYAFSESIKTFALTGISGARRNSFSPGGYRKPPRKKPKKSRLVLKNGVCNVYSENVSRKDRQFLRDIFTTLIDVQWRYILLHFACVFVTSWLFFAFIYYCICWLHGDFDFYLHHRADGSSSNNHTHNWTGANVGGGGGPLTLDQHQLCVVELRNFVSAFLYSVETQSTIGYGVRFATDTCLSAVTTVCVQSICGILIQSVMVGLVFAKLTRPKKRAETLIFSEKAVISLRDGQLCCLVRVGDMRSTHLVEAHVRMQLIQKRVTEEGEVEPLYQYELKVGEGEGDASIFLVWPITLCHVIDENSPLSNYCSADLPSAQFELIIILEGIVESTGMTAQARSSYLPTEIIWGHRFEKLVNYQRDNGQYKIDYSLFHKTYPVNTPRCSAKEFYRIKKSGVRLTDGTPTSSSAYYFCKQSPGGGESDRGGGGAEDDSRSSIGGASGCPTPSGTPPPPRLASKRRQPLSPLVRVATVDGGSTPPGGGRRKLQQLRVRRGSSPIGGTTATTAEEDEASSTASSNDFHADVVSASSPAGRRRNAATSGGSPPSIVVESPTSNPPSPFHQTLGHGKRYANGRPAMLVSRDDGDDDGVSVGISNAPSFSCSILSQLSELSEDVALESQSLTKEVGPLTTDEINCHHNTAGIARLHSAKV